MSEPEDPTMFTAADYETYVRPHIDLLEAEIRELHAEIERLRKDRDNILAQNDERWRKLDQALTDRVRLAKTTRSLRAEIETLSEQLKHVRAENRYLVFGDDSEESD